MKKRKIPITNFLITILVAAGCLSFWFAREGIAGERPDFDIWLEEFRTEALSKGISEATLNKAFEDLKPIPTVIERDRNQPEVTLTLEKYLSRIVTARLINKGQKKWTEHRVLLTKISHQYGVQAQFIVALWGIESRFGRITGDFPILAALATLAYDGRRSAFFRRELLHALRILDDGHITVEKMKGSWAGAMGQVQFMPSSFQHYAVDFNGDGRKDLWSDLGDVFASAANYLSRFGWKGDQPWGTEVLLPDTFDGTLAGIKKKKRLSAWQQLGIRPAGNGALPQMPGLHAALIRPDGPTGRSFLVYNNYHVILKWNRSHFFGVAVGTLADSIALP